MKKEEFEENRLKIEQTAVIENNIFLFHKNIETALIVDDPVKTIQNVSGLSAYINLLYQFNLINEEINKNES